MSPYPSPSSVIHVGSNVTIKREEGADIGSQLGSGSSNSDHQAISPPEWAQGYTSVICLSEKSAKAVSHRKSQSSLQVTAKVSSVYKSIGIPIKDISLVTRGIEAQARHRPPSGPVWPLMHPPKVVTCTVLFPIFGMQSPGILLRLVYRLMGPSMSK